MQVPCSWGALYYGSVWREFVRFYRVRVRPPFFNFTQELLKAGGHLEILGDPRVALPRSHTNAWPRSWKRFMVDFMFGRGLVMAYPSLGRQQHSFSTTYAERGAHSGEEFRPEEVSTWELRRDLDPRKNVPLLRREELPAVASALEQAPVYDELPVFGLHHDARSRAALVQEGLAFTERLRWWGKHRARHENAPGLRRQYEQLADSWSGAAEAHDRRKREVAGRLNALFEAWDGNPRTVPQSLPRAGLIVHSTRWYGVPAPPPAECGFRHYNVLRTTHDGGAADESPLSLSLLNRGMTNLYGSNFVAFQKWAWEAGDVHAHEHNTTFVVRAIEPNASGPILLAATGLEEDDILCGMARDGITTLRYGGCGCSQRHARLREERPAIVLGFEGSQLATNLRSLAAGENETVVYTGRNEWSECQRGSAFFCDALSPPGWSRRATDGSCVRDLSPAGTSVRERGCGSSLCAWRSNQAQQLLEAQRASLYAWRARKLEDLRYPRADFDTAFNLMPRSTDGPHNELISTYRRYVPAVDAILVMQPKHAGAPNEMVADCQRFTATWRGARKAAAALGQARGKKQPGRRRPSQIPVLCLRIAPGHGEPAVVSMAVCMRMCLGINM